MMRPFQWLVHRVGGARLAIIALFELALLSIAWDLSQMVRGLDVELLATIMTTGACTGWLLGRSRLRGYVALVIALAAALLTVFLRVGQLGAKFLAFGIAFGQALGQLEFGQSNVKPLFAAASPLWDGVSTLLTRLAGWVGSTAAWQPSTDLVALALVWSFFLWLATAWAAWMLRRKVNPFFALMPLMLFLAFVTSYSGHNVVVLFLLIGAFLALMVIVPHLARQQRWQKQGISSAQDLGFDLALVAIPSIIGIVVAGVLIPTISPATLAKAVQEWTRPESNKYNALSDSFGIVPAPRPTTVFDNVAAPGLPRSHLIGASPELLKQLAFVVETDDATRTPAPYYWLNTTYDIYTGHGWVTSLLHTNQYQANEPLPQAAPANSHTLHETVNLAQGSGSVYAAGTLVSIDHAFQVAWREYQDMFAAKVQANRYQVESRVTIYSPDDLRAASTEYPAWIRAQYLALPGDVPPRVLALARDLTATVPTAYDRARAIETFLHTFPYTLDLPPPPLDRDVTDYFLFDLRRGYCDYYATAMTVLARAAGLPARIAVGYASGEFDSSTGRYTVTEANAHSWTQVYFPDYGWIDFEPTTGRATLTETGTGGFPPEWSPPHGETESNPTATWLGNPLENPAYIALGIVLLIVGGLAGFVFMDSVRLERLPANATAAALYQRLGKVARHLGLTVSASDTPTQVAALLRGYFESPARPKRFQPVLHSAVQVMTEIVETFVETTYGAYSVSTEASQKLLSQWLDLRVSLWLVMAWHFVAERVEQLRSRGQ